MKYNSFTKKNIFCNNCGIKGHCFNNCRYPITSIGIILYRYNQNNDIEYLMIRRRNSLGFMDFIRGKYNIYNKQYLMNIINEMTINEKQLLLEHDFDYLWKYLWNNNIEIKYANEENSAREKFEQLKDGIITKDDEYNLFNLIKESNTKWEEEEWGFPKGRRNFHEKDIYTAIREFTEETGIPKMNIDIIQNLLPFEEVFTGSNFKSYKHKYFLAFMRDNNCNLEQYQKSEVGKMEWKTFFNCIKCMRIYNKEKMIMLDKIHKTLLNTGQIAICNNDF
jgi:8-oxo-dGTP pyrophosphatase MutT (NUDIX family)